MADAILDHVKNLGLDELAGPHITEYFGPWAIQEAKGRALADVAGRQDLLSHIREAQAAREAGRGGSSADGREYDVQDGIALLNVSGTIMKYGSSFGGGGSTVRLRRQIRQAIADPDVQGILIKIDSPGGTVSGTPDAADEIAAAAQRKPVHAFIEDLGASAAYWLASQASQISANATGEIGSIGVFMVVYDTSKYFEKEGIKTHVLRTGEFKGGGAQGAPISDAQLADWQRGVDEIYDVFTKAVARGRNLPIAKVRELADGRVHMAKAAQAMGLIDSVSTFDQAFRAVKAAAKAASSKDSRNMAAADSATDTKTENPATPTPKVETFTQVQVDQARTEAAAAASKTERERCHKIVGLCATARAADKAAKFVADGASIEQVQGELITALCAGAPAVNAAPAENAEAGADSKDPDAAYKKEFAANRAHFDRFGTSEADYVRSRRIDDGKEPLLARK